MPTLLEILNDPNYINANDATKKAIFDRYAPQDQNYTGANEATQFAIRQRFGVEGFAQPVAEEPEKKASALTAGFKSYLPQLQETYGGVRRC